MAARPKPSQAPVAGAPSARQSQDPGAEMFKKSLSMLVVKSRSAPKRGGDHPPSRQRPRPAKLADLHTGPKALTLTVDKTLVSKSSIAGMLSKGAAVQVPSQGPPLPPPAHPPPPKATDSIDCPESSDDEHWGKWAPQRPPLPPPAHPPPPKATDFIDCPSSSDDDPWG